MSVPDLTPIPFLEQLRMRQALRRWIAPISLAGVVAVVPIFLAFSKPADRTGQLIEERVIQAEARTDDATAQVQTLRVLIAQRERELKAEQQLTARPDWKAVLTLVGQQFDENLVLAAIQLDDIDNARVRSALGPMAGDAPAGSVWLVINGFATANSDVSSLVTRLETVGLFEQVVMTGTQREPFAGRPRTTFTLACRVQ